MTLVQMDAAASDKVAAVLLIILPLHFDEVLFKGIVGCVWLTLAFKLVTCNCNINLVYCIREDFGFMFVIFITAIEITQT